MAEVMFSQDDGKVHVWGDGWEFTMIPGALPLAIEAFGTPPESDDFHRHVAPLLQQWSRNAGILSSRDRQRLQRFKDQREES